ncbi:spore maturation protein A [Intestinibacillus massiliensis]|uniref:nucleoside recognition domain-containing protein n=1 Tax=Intestinibacillus massiliensis TaxID=1871029 RepID=UPI001D070488|nr:nucleoside recognition domain-containing protein [Intestinibacillus massiliensis]MCB6366875.1 spore maturation protein A [Intestinibacillus massiliensis]
MISKLWVAFLALSLVFGAMTGRLDAVSAAAAKGATEAVSLILSITGIMCLWSGVMELVSASGLAGKIASLLRPLLRPLFGKAAADREAMEAVSANVTANLLGLSNAATPIGLRAADRLYTVCGRRGAPDAVLTLIVLNTASIQLIPSTVAAVRAGYGAQNPYDIMPAVWGASVLSVLVVILASRILRKFWGTGNSGSSP